MKLARSFLAVLFAVSLVASIGSIAAAAQDSLVGTWVGQTEVPDEGTDQVTLIITKTDKGFAGTIADSLGQIQGAAEIKDLTVADGAVTGNFALVDGSTVTIKLKLDAGALKGNWAHESGSTGEMTLQRKRPSGW